MFGQRSAARSFGRNLKDSLGRESVNISAPDLAGRRVLLVEDESLIVMLFEDTLTEMGCEIAGVASRFDDAIRKASALNFDVAILDVNLNNLRTFPIAEIIKSRNIPFVFATGYGATSIPEGLSGVPVLQKPFTAPELERGLRTALAAKR
jgi:CheY-like chemotaxis protein